MRASRLPKGRERERERCRLLLASERERARRQISQAKSRGRCVTFLARPRASGHQSRCAKFRPPRSRGPSRYSALNFSHHRVVETSVETNRRPRAQTNARGDRGCRQKHGSIGTKSGNWKLETEIRVSKTTDMCNQSPRLRTVVHRHERRESRLTRPVEGIYSKDTLVFSHTCAHLRVLPSKSEKKNTKWKKDVSPPQCSFFRGGVKLNRTPRFLMTRARGP